MPEEELRLAGLPYRAAARVVDLFVLLLAFVAVGTIVAGRLESDAPRNPYLADVIVFGLWASYEVVLHAIGGQTVGKMILRLRVVRLPDLGRPGPSRAFIRWFVPAGVAYVLGSVPAPWGFVTGALALGVFLYALIEPRRRGLHDLAAGTVVVTERGEASVPDDIIGT